MGPALMGLAEARQHVDDCPELAGLLARRDWLVTQAQLDPAQMHPLYRWLELPDSFPETIESVRALCAALRAPLAGDLRTRRRRLWAGDQADYHSATCELYMAAALVECGLSVTLGTPDLWIRDDVSSLYVELTSAQKTLDLAKLVVSLTDSLSGHGSGAQLVATHDTLRLTSKQRQTIVDLTVGVAVSGPLELTPVDISSIVAENELRVHVVPSQPYVGLQGGHVFAGADPMAFIESAISDKSARQLRDFAPAILGVELSGTDWSSHLWGITTAFGAAPTISVPTLPGLLGVLAYWQGRGSLRPYMRVWIANKAWQGPLPALAVRTLECLSGRSPSRS